MPDALVLHVDNDMKGLFEWGLATARKRRRL
jgi:hypothetical protein